jgi:hypothetical protein
MRRYGPIEFIYAEPVADALVADPTFRKWVLGQTKFAKYADGATKLLHEDMFAKRTDSAENWWRSHFNPVCQCFGCCGGKETDLLAIFKAATGLSFALHFEVKHPDDRFNKKKRDQALAYPERAQCWVKKTPNTVLAHKNTTTVLLFSERKRQEYAPHLEHFKTRITWEKVEKQFPNVWARIQIGLADRARSIELSRASENLDRGCGAI